MKSKLIKIVSIVALVGITSLSLISCNKKTVDKNKELTKVRLNEVVRSVFYAPMYVAINEGFFKEEGIEIDLSTGQGADKTMQQVLSKNADIGFAGPEQVIYINNQGREDYPVIFAQLTQTDGAFLVGREAKENFKWTDLKGAEIIGGRPGGVPEMAFEYALKLNGLDAKTDVKMVTNIDFTATSGAFKAGTGEYVTLFEPTALEIEQQGYGYVVASIGELGGIVPYTSYSAKISFIEKNPELIENFTKAIQKGLDFVHENDSKTIAKAILSFFPDTSLNDLTDVVERYKSQDTWPKTTNFTKDSFDHLQKIMMASGAIDTTVDYNSLIYTKD